MESQGSKTGRLLSKSTPLEVVADQSADGSYEIRVERGGAPPPEVVVVRAEPVAAASRSGSRWGLWLVAGMMVATATAWAVFGRGAKERPSSLSVDGAVVPGPEGGPSPEAVPEAAPEREAAAPMEAKDTGGPIPPIDPLLEPGAVPLSATTALGVAAEPVVEPVRAVLPAEAEPAPEAAFEPEGEPEPLEEEVPEEELPEEALEQEEPE